MRAHLLCLLDESDESSWPAADLRGSGCRVTVAGRLEAAETLLGQGPEVVVADLDLPETAGAWESFFQCCRRCRVPSLVFSGQGRPEVVTGPLAARADAVLLRTVRPAELLSRLRPLLRIHRLQRGLAKARRVLQQRRWEQEEELNAAAQIQQGLLPARLPAVAEFRFAWRFLPYERIGGDLFNIFQLDEATVMAYLFDVSGHGVSSAMVGVSVHQSLSAQTGRIVKRIFREPPYYTILSPAEVMAELEREYPFERFEKFFTIVYLLLDSVTGEVRYSSAGHPPPILVRCNGEARTLPDGGGLIGIGVGGPYPERQVQLEPGDRLYLYSDGITEACNPQGEFFGLPRLLGLLAQLQALPLDEGCGRVVEALQQFGKGRPRQDDVTLVALEYLGEGGPPQAPERRC